MTDAQGRTISREHPEDVLLNKLEQTQSLRSMVDLLIWVLSELGYKRLADAATKRLMDAAKEAAAKSTEEELGKPRPLRSLKERTPDAESG